MPWESDSSASKGAAFTGKSGAASWLVSCTSDSIGIRGVQWSDQEATPITQSFESNAWDDQFLIEENYARGEDLVCLSPEAMDSQLTPSTYWSLVEGTESTISAIDTRLSVQTSTLKAQPELMIQWLFPGATLTELRVSKELCESSNRKHENPLNWHEGQIDQELRFPLVQWRDQPGFVMPMVFPTDLAEQAFAEEDGQVVIKQTLDLPLMEKGVIRTARARLVAGRVDADEAALARQALAFFESELPLTT